MQKSFAVIANMADDSYRNRTEKDEKVISQAKKDSIRKCADAAVFLGKINQEILNSRREKIPSELSRNYKQLIFKTEDHPKLFWGDDFPKTIKNISETNKVGQSLTQKYHHILTREMFTKTGEPFYSKARVINKEEGPGRMFNHFRRTNKGSQSIGSARTLLCQTISI